MLDKPLGEIIVGLKNLYVTRTSEKSKEKQILPLFVCKRLANFFGHVMRREILEHLVTTTIIRGKRSERKTA